MSTARTLSLHQKAQSRKRITPGPVSIFSISLLNLAFAISVFRCPILRILKDGTFHRLEHLGAAANAENRRAAAHALHAGPRKKPIPYNEA